MLFILPLSCHSVVHALPVGGPGREADTSSQLVLNGQCLCCALCRFPNLKSVRELILKRGQAKINNKTVPLTDNTVIEEHLGECCSMGVWWLLGFGPRVCSSHYRPSFFPVYRLVVNKGIDTLLFFRAVWCHLPGRPHP